MVLKYKIFQLFVLLFLIGCNSSSSVDSSKVSKLEALTGDKIYFGAFPDFGGSEDKVTTKRLTDFEQLI